MFSRRSRIEAERVCSEVIVTCKSGTAFRGVLFDADERVLLLRNAALVSGQSGTPTPVDGEVLVMRVDVDFVQVLR